MQCSVSWLEKNSKKKARGYGRERERWEIEKNAVRKGWLFKVQRRESCILYVRWRDREWKEGLDVKVEKDGVYCVIFGGGGCVSLGKRGEERVDGKVAYTILGGRRLHM